MTGQKLGLKGMWKWIELLCLMVGSIVGVGFVSGAEIFHSFARFGANCFFGIFVVFVLMFLLCFKIFLEKFKNKKCVNLQNFDKNNAKNTNITKVFVKNSLVFLSLILVSAAMFSGLKNLISELFFNNQVLIFLLCVFVVIFILLMGFGGVAKFNVFVVMFLVFVTAVLLFEAEVETEQSINLIQQNTLDFSFKNITLSGVFAVLFVFLNVIEIQPAIEEFDGKTSQKTALIFSFVFAFVFVAVLCVFTIFLFKNASISQDAMPILKLFKQKGGWMFVVYVLGLLMGLVSTLLACLMGVKSKLKNKISSNGFATFLAVFLSLVLSFFEFSFFVEFVYPIVGMINFVVFVFL